MEGKTALAACQKFTPKTFTVSPQTKFSFVNLKTESGMALSRIWAAFIIVAVMVAGIRMFATDNKVIFTSMVTGRSGDTVKLRKDDTSSINAAQLQTLSSLPAGVSDMTGPCHNDRHLSILNSSDPVAAPRYRWGLDAGSPAALVQMSSGSDRSRKQTRS